MINLSHPTLKTLQAHPAYPAHPAHPAHPALQAKRSDNPESGLHSVYHFTSLHVFSIIFKEVFMAKKGRVVINRELCKGCYFCVRACPVKILERDTEANSTGAHPAKFVDSENLSEGKCIACGNCYEVCPDVCIEVYGKE